MNNVHIRAHCQRALVGPLSGTTVQLHALCCAEVVGPLGSFFAFASRRRTETIRMPLSQLSRLTAFMTNPLRNHYRSVNSKKKYYIFQNSRNKVPATHVIVIAWKFKIRLRRKRSDREAKADLKRSGRQERGKSRARGSQGSLWAEDVSSAYFFIPK